MPALNGPGGVERRMKESELVWVHGLPIEVPEAHFERHVEPRTLVRFAGPIRSDWKRALTDRSVPIEFWCPPFGACVTLPSSIDPSQLGALFSFRAGAGAYREPHCTRNLDAQVPEVRARAGMLGDLIDIICLSSSARADVERELSRLGVAIVARSSSKLRVRHTGDLAMLRDLPGVKIAE